MIEDKYNNKRQGQGHESVDVYPTAVFYWIYNKALGFVISLILSGLDVILDLLGWSAYD